MTPKLQRQRPDPESHLVRKPEPIRTGAGDAEALDTPSPTPPPAAPSAPSAPAARTRPTPPDRSAPKAQGHAPRGRSAAARPSARDLTTPARPIIAREALKADVPADLDLLHRLRRYRLDTGTDIRDQVAIAVDEWLTSQGY